MGNAATSESNDAMRKNRTEQCSDKQEGKNCMSKGSWQKELTKYSVVRVWDNIYQTSYPAVVTEGNPYASDVTIKFCPKYGKGKYCGCVVEQKTRRTDKNITPYLPAHKELCLSRSESLDHLLEVLWESLDYYQKLRETSLEHVKNKLVLTHEPQSPPPAPTFGKDMTKTKRNDVPVYLHPGFPSLRFLRQCPQKNIDDFQFPSFPSSSAHSSAGRARSPQTRRPNWKPPEPGPSTKREKAACNPNTWRDYFALLEIDETEDPQKIRAAYKKACLRWHPDKNGGCAVAEERFKRISDAYRALAAQLKFQ